LLHQLRRQTLPLASLAELVITHQGLTAPQQATLERAAGRPIRFVELPAGTDYYEAKNRGFEATQAEVVAFGDSDCWPDADWLEHLFAPFREAEVQVVAGRTCYRRDLFGTAATTIDFMYFERGAAAGCTRNFYANNVAFRRDVFAADGYRQGEGFYRGNCQTLGLRLAQHGVPIRFEPRARTTHRFPDSLRELLRLRLLRGADSVELNPQLADAYLPPKLRWLGRLGPVTSAAGLGARLGFSLASINRQEMPEVHGVRWLACAAVVAGISCADGLGAALATAGWRSGDVHTALAYHEDSDRLRDAA